MKKPNLNNKDPIIRNGLPLRLFPVIFGWPNDSAFDREQAPRTPCPNRYFAPLVENFHPGGLIVLKAPSLWITPAALETVAADQSDRAGCAVIEKATFFAGWRDFGAFTGAFLMDPDSDGMIVNLGDVRTSTLFLVLHFDAKGAIVVLRDEVK